MLWWNPDIPNGFPRCARIEDSAGFEDTQSHDCDNPEPKEPTVPARVNSCPLDRPGWILPGLHHDTHQESCDSPLAGSHRQRYDNLANQKIQFGLGCLIKVEIGNVNTHAMMRRDGAKYGKRDHQKL